jgi:probable rRNA maturation factor
VINFYSQSINFTLRNKTKLRKWINSAIKNEKRISVEISFIFCNDSYLLKLNKSYLSHNYYTDIITFDYSENQDVTIGDIFISIQRVRDNAGKFNKTFPEELHRVIIHGVLHLIGYNDASKREKKLMTSKEDYYLSLLDI